MKLAEPSIKLRAYQAEGVGHLLRQPQGGLLMDPGTGKTVTVLSTYYQLFKRKALDLLIIVAPLQVAYEVWPAEIEKWSFPFQCTVLHGDKKDHLLSDAFESKEKLPTVLVLNYDGLEWFLPYLTQLRKKWPRIWFVADESTKLKHTSTSRFKNLRPYLPMFARRTILTGTPSPNGLIDLFGQVLVCDLGATLGQYITQYRREYFYPSGYNGYDWVPQPDAEERIYKALDGMFYRVSDDVLHLPKIHHIDKFIDLSPKVRKLYDKLEDEFVLNLKGHTVTAANAAVLTSKLRQVANGILYGEGDKVSIIHDEKLDALEDLTDELQGNPLLVGYEFTADGERIAKKYKAPFIRDMSSRAQISDTLKSFNRGEIPVLPVQMDATAHGLNLQESCHHIACYGLGWNLETHLQFFKRVHRGGQKKTVFVHRLLARNTMDETVAKRLVAKKKRQDNLLSAITERYM